MELKPGSGQRRGFGESPVACGDRMGDGWAGVLVPSVSGSGRGWWYDPFSSPRPGASGPGVACGGFIGKILILPLRPSIRSRDVAADADAAHLLAFQPQSSRCYVLSGLNKERPRISMPRAAA
jgi:hypothetical protein